VRGKMPTLSETLAALPQAFATEVLALEHRT
jgi:hypothetical protein